MTTATMLSVRETARRLGVHENTVRNWQKRGLIRAVRPDVLITGGEDAIEEGIGVDLVREWGGKVTVADVLPGHSTQATLERIRG